MNVIWLVPVWIGWRLANDILCSRHYRSGLVYSVLHSDLQQSKAASKNQQSWARVSLQSWTLLQGVWIQAGGSLEEDAAMQGCPCPLDNSFLLSLWLLPAHHQPFTLHQRSSGIQSDECKLSPDSLKLSISRYSIYFSSFRMECCQCYLSLGCCSCQQLEYYLTISDPRISAVSTISERYSTVLASFVLLLHLLGSSFFPVTWRQVMEHGNLPSHSVLGWPCGIDSSWNDRSPAGNIWRILLFSCRGRWSLFR